MAAIIATHFRQGLGTEDVVRVVWGCVLEELLKEQAEPRYTLHGEDEEAVNSLAAAGGASSFKKLGKARPICPETLQKLGRLELAQECHRIDLQPRSEAKKDAADTRAGIPSGQRCLEHLEHHMTQRQDLDFDGPKEKLVLVSTQ